MNFFYCNTYSELFTEEYKLEDGDVVYCHENGKVYKINRNDSNITYEKVWNIDYSPYRDIYRHYEPKSKVNNLNTKSYEEIKHRENNYKTCFVCGQSIKNPKIGKYRDKYCEKCGVYLPEIIYKGA